jgi:hypothetical protein
VAPEKPAPTPQKKDPNAPKRPANAFFFFCQMERANFKEANQDASLSDLTKLLGQKWKSLTTEQKKVIFFSCEFESLSLTRTFSNIMTATTKTKNVTSAS